MLKKLKEKLSKKKIITIGIALIAIITTVVAILINQPGTRTKKKRISADSELARAMTYDQFADGDENVDGTNINSSYDDTTKPATNSKEEKIGTKETINGKEYYTVTTDDKGEITADLPQGMYKTSREGKTEMVATMAKGIGNNKDDRIQGVVETNDGGIIVAGYFYSDSVDLENGVTLTNKGSGFSDGMIIKYNAKGKCEWAKDIGGSNYDYINSISKTSDGGILAVGHFASSSIEIEDGISLTNKGDHDGIIIKYNAEGKCEWAKDIGGSAYENIASAIESRDGGIIAVGASYSSIDFGNGVNITSNGYADGLIIKYDKKGEVEWAKGVGGDGFDQIKSVAETNDRGIVVGGYFSSSSIKLENGETLTKKGDEDAIIIKYNASGEIEWAKVIGGNDLNNINSIVKSNDGGIVVVGNFSVSSIDFGNGVVLTKQGSDSSTDGMIIKYNTDGECEWAKSIGGNSWEDVCSIARCNDGGYVIGGYFKSDSIDLGDGINLSNSGDGKYDGMLIKYNAEGKCEWAKVVGGKGTEYIYSVTECSDGSYLIGGSFNTSIDLENGVNITNKGSFDGMVAKYYVRGLSYTVNYLEKGTNEILHQAKTTGDQKYGVEIVSANEIIDIDGYKYDSVDKDKLVISTGTNVINIYYTKRTDLSYTVNYLEKTTNKVLHTAKTVGNKTFGDIITSENEKITIDGYNYDSVDKTTLTIGTGTNVINIYYTKRNDLSYTVNYLEKTTNKVLHTAKTVGNKTFGDIITSANEKITIDGYNYDSVDKTTLTIGTGTNVINIYYTKRTDLSYKVNYLEKTTNKILHIPKTKNGMTFQSTIKATDEVIAIYGYKYDSADKDTLTIGTGTNVINIYYTKRTDLSYTVNYLEKTTNKVLHEAKQ